MNLFNGGLNTRLAPHLIGAADSVVNENVDISKGALSPLKADTDESQLVDKSMVYFNGQWVSSTDDLDYVEFQEKLYYSDGSGRPQKSSDGTTWYNLGITKPSAAPTVATGGAGVLDATYQYCYTYYNVNDGTESQPSTYSVEIVPALQSVNVAVVASSDAQVTNIRVYRIGGDLTAMTLVEEIANTTATYNDNLGDLAVDGHLLDSSGNKEAPTGLKYLTETNAMFFGAVGDKLYYSDIAYVNYWSAFNFIDFPSEITGLAVTQNGGLVFTAYETYIVTGNSPATLSKYLLSANQGCLLHKSIKYSNNTAVWLSSDGICSSQGGEIVVSSRDKLGKLSLSNPKAAIVYDDVYYLSHDGGTLALDFRFRLAMVNLDVSPEGWHINDDTLYYSLDGDLYSLGTSVSNKELTYRSGNISEGSLSNLKNYKVIYTHSSGTLTLTVYIDDILVSTKILAEGSTEILVPQDKRLGYYISFGLTGTGTLNELEYKVEGRQNGR